MAHITKKSNIGGVMSDVVKMTTDKGQEKWVDARNTKRLAELGWGYAIAPTTPIKPTTPTIQKTGGYEGLRDVGGTIYAGERGFKTPEKLGTYLGKAPHEIDWGQIKKGGRRLGGYEGLKNVDGEIQTAEGRAFEDPTELSGYLGMQPHEIDWSRISKSPYNEVIDDEVESDPYQELLDRWIAEQKTQSEAPSWEDQQTKLREEHGVGALEEQIGSFDDEINRANTLLDDLETRVRGGMAKESARLAPMELITGRQQELSQQAGVQHQDILSVLREAQRGRETAVGELERKEKNIFDILKARETESGQPMDDLIQEFKFRTMIDAQRQSNETELDTYTNKNGERITVMYDAKTGETREINLGSIYQEDKLLSASQCATLGVPYGTTESQAAQMGITPTRWKGTTGGGAGGGGGDGGADKPTSQYDLSSPTPPDAFRKALEEANQMSISSPELQKAWDEYRNTEEDLTVKGKPNKDKIGSYIQRRISKGAGWAVIAGELEAKGIPTYEGSEADKLLNKMFGKTDNDWF